MPDNYLAHLDAEIAKHERALALLKELREIEVGLRGDAETKTQDAQQILTQICKKHDLKVSDLIGKSRKAEIVAARHEAMYLLHRNTNLTKVAIGELFGRDHSTVLSALAKFTPIPRSAELRLVK